jgi:hypothetical protein
MRRYRPFLFITVITLVAGGCYYDKAETLFPPEAKCETANMKFAANIRPILTATCTRCHSSGAQNGGRFVWSIENFSTLQAKALNGSLVQRITLPQGHSLLMPQGGPKLDSCSILMIKSWVAAGAINN